MEKPDLDDAIYARGTLKVHHVDRISSTQIQLYYNSPFKREAEVLTTLSWLNMTANEESLESELADCDGKSLKWKITLNGKSLYKDDIVKVQWVKVFYEEEMFLGKVLKVVGTQAQVRCLERPFKLKEHSEFEREENAVFYNTCYQAAKMIESGRKWLWTV